jgi:excisionase family DNA binding protein
MISVETISVTVKRACELTGLSHTTIYKLLGEGKLHAVKIGRRTLIGYGELRGLCSGVQPGVKEPGMPNTAA